ncbi:MAG: NADH-quinone oxidoreductase subunit J [Verrucomicrobiales bacterium]|nr:NADH-quinone oxidoreductase subunit J [Verrucomicrobiales bacterium]MCP5559256.1 NADH-quinone oxidoreductase subunit J [Verrucomicrobiaceae bacterium]
MSIPFLIIAAVILASAWAAVSLRNLVHCGLCAALSFLATGTLYLYLNAEFLGLVQLMVYVGAVAVLILFTVLLTRPATEAADAVPTKRPAFWKGALIAITVGGAVASCLAVYAAPKASTAPELSIQEIGRLLTASQQNVLALIIVALLMTTALIGALLLAAPAEEDTKGGGA